MAQAFVSFWRVLVGALLYLVFRLIRARYLRVGQNFILAESIRANKDQCLTSSSCWWNLPEDLVTDQILSSWNANIGPMFDNIFSLRFFSLAFQPVNLDFGLDRKPDLVLGPCDGLFCLYWKHPRDFWTSWRSCIALWNPATRAFSILPMSKLDHPPHKTMVTCMVGFGFDLTTKSIKVVKFVGFDTDTSYVNCAEVYDVGSGSWRVVHVDDTAQAILDLDDPTHCRYNTNDGVFLWYAYQWRGSNEVSEVLVLSFDMSRELFHVTLMPDKYNPVNPRMRHPTTKLKECQLSLSRDSLAVHFSLFEVGHGTVEIWVMKKDFYHGVEGGESFSYSLSHELTVELPYTRPCLSMGVWNKNELLLWEVDALVLGEFFMWMILSKRFHGVPQFLCDIVTKQARDFWAEFPIQRELSFSKESLKVFFGYQTVFFGFLPFGRARCGCNVPYLRPQDFQCT
ncbi:hypothetical protein Vadar_005667 [Vaccinium darrowii]|uniref:Uncharacterized protein n=1 Tax=Vaccinium darrowii TaxID=229202 RepID=A0ACB7X7J5_9ERIC|nr:hypothetical protein Vadar_005667 [Vaccinium darrowii]